MNYRRGLALLMLALTVPLGCDSEDQCAMPCVELGMCTRQGDDCIVASDADCQKSKFCKGPHSCRAEAGQCVFSHEFCAQRPDCKKLGLCRGGSVGCVLGSDEDCAASEICRSSGDCAAASKKDSDTGGEYGVCVAKTREHCAPTEGCKTEGRCSPVEGSCQIGGREDCLQSTRCKTDGMCSPPGPGGDKLCLAMSDEDCQLSDGCKNDKRCYFHVIGFNGDKLAGDCKATKTK